MAYTQDDYLKDLMTIKLGDGYEKMEAQARVKLYEAGRYTQLNTLITEQNKENTDLDYELYERQAEQIDKQINTAMQIWLNTPASDHELWMQRNQEFDKIKKEGEARKEELFKEYKKKVEQRARKDEMSGLLFFAGIIAVLGGIVILLLSWI